MRRLSQNEYLGRVRKIHCYPDGTPKYVYDDKFQYIGKRYPVTIFCPRHGYFTMLAGNHLNGQGCPDCANEHLKYHRLKRTEDFRSDLQRLFDGAYELLDEDYTGNKKFHRFSCRLCGKEIKARPNDLFSGRAGCKECKAKIHTSVFPKDWYIEQFRGRYGDKYD